MGITDPRILLEEVPRERAGDAVLGEHLSVSQIKTFQRCPEQWRQRYVLGIKTPPGIALIQGRADHAAHELNFQQKIQTGADLPLPDVEDAFSTELDKRYRSELDEWGAVSGLGEEKGKKYGDVKDTGIRMVRTYHRLVSPTVKPIAVELELRVEVPGCPVPLLGYVDVVTDASAIERKTAARASFDNSWRAQALIYAHVLKRPVDIHVVTKAKETKVIHGEWIVEPTPVASAAIAQLIAHTATQIHDMAERFGLDRPWPGRITDSDACSWCGYRPRCHWWQV